MRADADFMVYVAARWPSLVREAVLLGARPSEAAEATTDALSRCRRDWGRASREEDVDALVHAELLRAVRRRSRAPRGAAASSWPRSCWCWPRRRSRSSSTRSAPTTARSSSAPRWSRSRCCSSAVGRGRLPGDVRRRREAAPDAADDVLENAAITQEENPAPGVVWYADGAAPPRPRRCSPSRGSRDMTRIGTGVVYGDDEGRVVYAADDGSREVLGHKDPDVPVAATDETGLGRLGRDPGRPARGSWSRRPRPATTVATAAVDADARVVAVDGRRRLLRRRRGRARAAPGRRRPSSGRSARRDLLDVRSRIRAFQVDRGHDRGRAVRLQRPVPSSPGTGAALSPDGNLVATRLPGTDRGRALRRPLAALSSRRRARAATTWSAVAPGDRLTVPTSSRRRLDARTRARAAAPATCDHAAVPDRRPGSPTRAARRCWHAEAWEPCTSSARSTSSAPAR